MRRPVGYDNWSGLPNFGVGRCARALGRGQTGAPSHIMRPLATLWRSSATATPSGRMPPNVLHAQLGAPRRVRAHANKKGSNDG